MYDFTAKDEEAMLNACAALGEAALSLLIKSCGS
jgi:hypothetical protein